MNSKKQVLFVGFFFVAILTVLFFITAKEFSQEYSDTETELNGISKILKIYNVNITLKAIRGLTQLSPEHEKSLKKDLFINEDILKKEINSINDKFIKDVYFSIVKKRKILNKFEIFGAYTKLIEILKHKRIDIASQSKLFLDTEKESYYLMSLFVIYIPDIAENVGQIRGLGTGLLTSKKNSNEMKLLLKLNVENFFKKIDNIKYYVSKLPPDAKNELNDKIDNILANFYNLNKSVNHILNDTAKIQPQEYFLKGSLLINKINILFIAIKDLIVKKLAKRKSEFYRKLFISIVIYILLLFFTMLFLYKYYLKLRKDLLQVEKKKREEEMIKVLRDEYMQQLSLQDTGYVSLNCIVDYFKCINASLYIFDSKNNKLYLCATYGIDVENLKQTLDMNENLISANIFEKNIKITDINQKVNVGNISLNSSKLLTITMMEFEKPVGVVQLWFDENFYNIDLDFLQRVVSLMASYINKTQRDEELKKQLALIDKHVLISRTDLEGNITEVSSAFCRLFGYSEEEFIGKNHRILKHPDTANELIKDLWQTITKGKIWEGEIKNKTKSGKYVWVHTVITPDKDLNGNVIGYTAIRADITDKKRVEALAITDGLTCLYNRRYFDDIFYRQIQIAKRNKSKLVFAILDIDHFKQFNDIYGHQAGDETLKQVAKTLQDTLRRPGDYVFRLGGEEFGLLFQIKNEKDGFEIVDTVRKNIEDLKMEHTGNSASPYVTVSIGFCIINPNDVADIKTIYKKTDDALYKAKEAGRNRIVKS